MAVFLNGAAVADPRERGISDDSFLLLFNARGEPVTFALPGPGFATRWQVAVDTATSGARTQVCAGELLAGGKVDVAEHTVLVLQALD